MGAKGVRLTGSLFEVNRLKESDHFDATSSNLAMREQMSKRRGSTRNSVTECDWNCDDVELECAESKGSAANRARNRYGFA